MQITDHSATNTEDINMGAPPVITREFAAALFAEMQKYQMNGKYFC